MKLYATTTSERASKGQGGNKELDISLLIGSSDKNKQVLRILAKVLPKEASISDKESVVIMIMKENDDGHIQEVTDRLVYSLPSCVEIKTREQALEIKGEKEKGDNYLFESSDKTIKRILNNSIDSRYDDVEIE